MSYNEKVTQFVNKLNEATGLTFAVETGRKFDKVYVNGKQKMGRYMVERKTGNIFAIKSWAQVNTRRWFGTLDNIDQFDWSDYHGVPLAGSEVETLIKDREEGIVSGYKKRGRPRKVTV